MSQTKVRILKVSEIGDFWAKRTKPQIRLVGLWLERAGIQANHRVLVENPHPGVLVIRLIENSHE